MLTLTRYVTRYVTRCVVRCFAENLAPSELKKLRNKQRKARRKAELERQEKQEKQEKQQSRKGPGDQEPDAPHQDELIPDKLARVRPNVLFFQGVVTRLSVYKMYNCKNISIIFTVVFL